MSSSTTPKGLCSGCILTWLMLSKGTILIPVFSTGCYRHPKWASLAVVNLPIVPLLREISRY